MIDENQRLIIRVPQRENEQATLMQAVESAREGSVAVVFVGGKSGNGISSLTKSSFTDIVGVWKASAHFVPQDAPFTALRELLEELCERIAKAPSTKTYECQEALARELPAAQQDTLIELAPKAKSLLSAFRPDDDGLDLEPDDEETTASTLDDSRSVASSLNMSMCNTSMDFSSFQLDFDSHQVKDGIRAIGASIGSFFRAISSIQPTILSLDDIMWADAASLDVLQAILCDSSLKNLLFCASYQIEADSDDEDIRRPWLDWRKKIDAHHTIQTILLQDLELQETKKLIADATKLELNEVQDLAELVHGCTHGNIFFTIQMLENLQDQGMLFYDFGLMRWQWKLDQIKRRSSVSENVAHIVGCRIGRLSENDRDVLKLASCFGPRFDIDALESSKKVMEVDDIFDSLEEACQEELLLKINARMYKFSHEMIHETIYGRVPVKDRARIHWKIGLCLLESPRIKEDHTLFACADQLEKGIDWSDDCELDRTDRTEIAQLHLDAGKRAAGMSGFGPASRYLRSGILILDDGYKKETEQKYLFVKLFSLYAKTEYCLGHIEESRTAANTVIEYSNHFDDKRASYLVLISCFLAEGKSCELVDFCLRLLRKLEEKKLPLSHREPAALRVYLESRKMNRLLKDKTNNDLLALPKVKNQRKAFCVKILCEMVMPLQSLKLHSLLGLVINRMICLTLKYGRSSMTAEVFSLAGSYFIAYKNNIAEGHRFGALAEDLAGSIKDEEQKIGVLHYVASFTKWWVQPIPQTLDLLIEGNAIAMRKGDTGKAFQCIISYIHNYFYSGLPLEPLLADTKNYCLLMLEYKQPLCFLEAAPMWQCLQTLTCDGVDSSQELLDGEAMEKYRELENPHNIGSEAILTCSMQIAYYLGDIKKATELAAQIQNNISGLDKATLGFPGRSFFLALIALENYRDKKRRKFKVEADKHVTAIKRHVEKGSINLVHKLQLLEAEATSLQNTKFEVVYKKYQAAITSATRSGCLQDAALANYLCFRFCERQEFAQSSAEMFLHNAHEKWTLWGATAIANSLEERHSEIFINAKMDMAGLGSTNSRRSLRSRARFDNTIRRKHRKLSVIA